MIFSTLRHSTQRAIRSTLRTPSTTVTSNSATSTIRTKATSTSPSSYSRSGPPLPPGLLSNWYGIFGKSNSAYMTWIVVGVLAAELITGTATDIVWNSVNSGRTYDSVDWTQFKVEDDDDDEDDEDDEDEDEEEEGDEDDEDDE